MTMAISDSMRPESVCNLATRRALMAAPMKREHNGTFPQARRVLAGNAVTSEATMIVFPAFRLDGVNQCLWRRRDSGDDERIPLPLKAFSALRYLVEHAGRLVTKDELLEAVWPGIYVQPHTNQESPIRSQRWPTN
jgi:DNA-binding response OmpR family regulator